MLDIRKSSKAKKPTFLRQDSHKKGEISNNWRKPKGLQSKMRLKKKGYPRSIEIGWKSPTLVRGLTQDGLKPVIVNNVKDLENQKDVGLIISKSVGKKKRVEILNKAKELSLKVINIDSEKYLKSVTEFMESKKKQKKVKVDEKAKKVEKKKETKKDDKPKEEEIENKAKEDKKEKDKILTKKQ